MSCFVPFCGYFSSHNIVIVVSNNTLSTFFHSKLVFIPCYRPFLPIMPKFFVCFQMLRLCLRPSMMLRLKKCNQDISVSFSSSYTGKLLAKSTDASTLSSEKVDDKVGSLSGEVWLSCITEEEADAIVTKNCLSTKYNAVHKKRHSCFSHSTYT